MVLRHQSYRQFSPLVGPCDGTLILVAPVAHETLSLIPRSVRLLQVLMLVYVALVTPYHIAFLQVRSSDQV